MFKTIIIAAFLLVIITGFTLHTPKNKAKGFVKIFDGKTTKGWHNYNKNSAGAGWKVDNGSLHLDPTVKEGRGNLITDAAYENYHLRYQWKISAKGNSGLLFNVAEDAKYSEPYFTGPEMQVLDNDGHADGKIIKHRAGDLYDLISCTKETVKPVGEWNKAEIILNNGDLTFILNGEKVVHTTMFGDDWKAMVAKSKFKQWADFGTYKKGKLCLQDHGDEVWYRNIEVKQL
ncbi:MAG: DUF1080 domain-containing protein [Deinococcales bacterium]|nr:DUF1080 domain-containing protein [Chitinophagaceae bacterium]